MVKKKPDVHPVAPTAQVVAADDAGADTRTPVEPVIQTLGRHDRTTPVDYQL